MPTIIEIPNEALDDLKKIIELDDRIFESLLSAIGQTEPTLTSRQFTKKVVEKVQGLAEIDLQSILRAVFIFYSIGQRPERSIAPQELAEGVTNSSAVSKSADFPPEKKKKLSDRLTRLLQINGALSVTSKAIDVMTEHDRVFCGARILSDIRPVFSETLENAAAAVIIHNLEIGYHQDGTHHDFYVALDTEDIQKLKQVIDRAEKKTIALKSILKKS